MKELKKSKQISGMRHVIPPCLDWGHVQQFTRFLSPMERCAKSSRKLSIRVERPQKVVDEVHSKNDRKQNGLTVKLVVRKTNKTQKQARTRSIPRQRRSISALTHDGASESMVTQLYIIIWYNETQEKEETRFFLLFLLLLLLFS